MTTAGFIKDARDTDRDFTGCTYTADDTPNWVWGATWKVVSRINRPGSHRWWNVVCEETGAEAEIPAYILAGVC